MNIQFSEEKIKDTIEELKPLLEAHYKEVHLFPDKIPFNPDYDTYLAMEEAGVINLITVRDEGKLIGYTVAFLYPNLHYQDHVYAVNDIIYLDPLYRKEGHVDTLLRYAENVYKRLGASVMTLHMKVGIPFKGACERNGIELKEHMYMKYIGA